MNVTPVQTIRGQFLNHQKQFIKYEEHLGFWEDDPEVEPFFLNFEDLYIMDHRLQKELALPTLSEDKNLIYLWKFASFVGSHPVNFGYSLLMLYSMGLVDFSNKVVLDLGSAEGILSILALKYGATRIFAIDNNPNNEALLIKNLGLNNLSLASSVFFAEDIRNIEKIVDLLKGQNVEIVLANLGPHYGLTHLAAIDIIKKIPTVNTVVLAGYLPKH